MSQARTSLFKRHENLTPLSIFVGFIVIIVIMQLVTQGTSKYPTFISGVNLLNILQQVGVPGIVAVGMTLVMISGGIDLSVGMLASLVSIVTASGISKWHLGVPGAIAVGIMSAVVLETIMGFIISRTKVEPFIITLGGMITFQGIALLVSNSREVILNGELNFFKTNLIAGVKDPSTGLNLILPPYALIFFLIALLAGLMLTFTKYGRRIYAVGTNPHAAYLAGINVKNFKLLLYGVNGIFVAIATMASLSRLGTGNPLIGEGKEIEVIAAVVVGGTALSGGKGNIWGTFIGVLLLGCLSNALNILGVQPHWQYVLRGALIILAVLMGYYSSRRNASAKSRILKTRTSGA